MAVQTFLRIGKPEPLVGNLSGYWSRRMDEANRLVYWATDEDIVVVGYGWRADWGWQARLSAQSGTIASP